MKIEIFDNVLLKDGRKASVVDHLGDKYVVDIEIDGDFETILISSSEIVEIL